MRNMEPDNLKTNFKNKKNGLVSVLIILMVVIVCCIAIWYFSIKMTDNSDNNDKPMTTTTSTTTTAKPKKEYSMYDNIELENITIEEVKELYSLIEKPIDNYNVGDPNTNLYLYPTNLANMSNTVKMWFAYTNMQKQLLELNEYDLPNLTEIQKQDYAKIEIDYDSFISELDRVFGPSVPFVIKTVMPINTNELTKLSYNAKTRKYEAYVSKVQTVNNKTVVKNLYKAIKTNNNEVELYLKVAFNEDNKTYSDANYSTKLNKYINEDNILDNLDKLTTYKITYTLDTDQKYHFNKIELITN